MSTKAGCEVTESKPGTEDWTLHKLSNGFSIWESPKRRKGGRFEVIEPGAGPRGNARDRGRARTLQAALELAVTLKPSTPAEILAPWRESVYSDDKRKDIDELVRRATSGTRLWVLHGRDGREGPDSWGWGYAATSKGLKRSGVGSLIGELFWEVWHVAWVGDDGQEGEGNCVVTLEDARQAWWVVAPDGRHLAGGPGMVGGEARARELAVEYGGQAQLGLGTADPDAAGEAA